MIIRPRERQINFETIVVLFIKTVEHFGTIDIVVANAGVWPPKATSY